MRLLRLIPIAVAALAACAPAQKAGPADRQRDMELAVVMAVGAQDTTQLKEGQWALYSVRSATTTATMAKRLAVVGVEPDKGHFWIEAKTITPSPAGGKSVVISKYQIDASAKPLQLWIAEGSARPTKIPMESIPAPTADPKAKVEIAKERITVRTTGKEYDCTRLTSKATYPDGRETMLVTWCSPEVPFSVVHEGKSYGGVVRRTYGAFTLELDAKGTDAVPEMQLPEK